jgi:hypothetical protein
MLAGRSAWTAIDCSRSGVPLLHKKGETTDFAGRFDDISLTIPRLRLGTVGTIVVTVYRFVFLIPGSSQAYTCKRSLISANELLPYPGRDDFGLLLFELSQEGEHFSLQGTMTRIVDLHLSLANTPLIVTFMPAALKVISLPDAGAGQVVHGLAGRERLVAARNKKIEQALDKRFLKDLASLQTHITILQGVADELSQYTDPWCRSAYREICNGLGMEVGPEEHDERDGTAKLARYVNNLMVKFFGKEQNPSVILAPEAYACVVRSARTDFPSPVDFHKALKHIQRHHEKFRIKIQLLGKDTRFIMLGDRTFAEFKKRVVRNLGENDFVTVLSAAKELKLPRSIAQMYLEQCIADADLVQDKEITGTRYFRNRFVQFLDDARIAPRPTAPELAGAPVRAACASSKPR